MSTQVERKRATRRALVQAARELFADRGFGDTSIEAVVRRAGLTRGAFYHHFDDKTELFAAVLENVEAELVDRLLASPPPEGDPFELLAFAVGVFLDRYLDPAVRRIVLVEGPTVLGWQRWSAIERRFGLGLVEGPLRRAEEAGALQPLPVVTLSHALFGALMEGAMLLASSRDPRSTRAELEHVVRAVVDGLRM